MKRHKNLRFRIGEIIACLSTSILISIIVGKFAFDISILESGIIGVCGSIGLMVISGCLKIDNNISEDIVHKEIQCTPNFDAFIQSQDEGPYLPDDEYYDPQKENKQVDITDQILSSNDQNIDDEIVKFLGTGRH